MSELVLFLFGWRRLLAHRGSCGALNHRFLFGHFFLLFFLFLPILLPVAYLGRVGIRIGIDTLLFQICPSLLLAHYVCLTHSSHLLLSSTLLLLFGMLGGASLRPRPIDVPLVPASHFILF